MAAEVTVHIHVPTDKVVTLFGKVGTVGAVCNAVVELSPREDGDPDLGRTVQLIGPKASLAPALDLLLAFIAPPNYPELKAHPDTVPWNCNTKAGERIDALEWGAILRLKNRNRLPGGSHGLQHGPTLVWMPLWLAECLHMHHTKLAREGSPEVEMEDLTRQEAAEVTEELQRARERGLGVMEDEMEVEGEFPDIFAGMDPSCTAMEITSGDGAGPETVHAQLFIVLDTNVLLTSLSLFRNLRHSTPAELEGAGGRNVLLTLQIHIPWAVLNELDKLKKSERVAESGERGTLGKQARDAIHWINRTHEEQHGEDDKVLVGQSLTEQRKAARKHALPERMGPSADDRVLQCVLHLHDDVIKKEREDKQKGSEGHVRHIVFLCDDTNLRNKLGFERDVEDDVSCLKADMMPYEPQEMLQRFFGQVAAGQEEGPAELAQEPGPSGAPLAPYFLDAGDYRAYAQGLPRQIHTASLGLLNFPHAAPATLHFDTPDMSPRSDTSAGGRYPEVSAFAPASALEASASILALRSQTYGSRQPRPAAVSSEASHYESRVEPRRLEQLAPSIGPALGISTPPGLPGGLRLGAGGAGQAGNRRGNGERRVDGWVADMAQRLLGILAEHIPPVLQYWRQHAFSDTWWQDVPRSSEPSFAAFEAMRLWLACWDALHDSVYSGKRSEQVKKDASSLFTFAKRMRGGSEARAQLVEDSARALERFLKGTLSPKTVPKAGEVAGGITTEDAYQHWKVARGEAKEALKEIEARVGASGAL